MDAKGEEGDSNHQWREVKVGGKVNDKGEGGKVVTGIKTTKEKSRRKRDRQGSPARRQEWIAA